MVGKISIVDACRYWLTDFDLWCKDQSRAATKRIASES
jgi:hypothetical protein